MGLVMGLFFFVSGHFVLSFAANIVCGVAADLVAAAGKYRSKSCCWPATSCFPMA